MSLMSSKGYKVSEEFKGYNGKFVVGVQGSTRGPRGPMVLWV